MLQSLPSSWHSMPPLQASLPHVTLQSRSGGHSILCVQAPSALQSKLHSSSSHSSGSGAEPELPPSPRVPPLAPPASVPPVARPLPPAPPEAPPAPPMLPPPF